MPPDNKDPQPEEKAPGFDDLLAIAKGLAKERKLSENASAGTVAAAILTDRGNIYTGVCIDTPAGMGFCAEHSAIAAMVTAGESRIVKCVAAGVDDKGACAPCGRCREFICAVHDENYKCEVLLENGEVTTIGELLPYHM
ncbi:MAG: cytidine deaminase [Oscillospiraceae bacterium]|nr:cytidine deaminase [Oscillospiraceae bacterium]